MIVSFGDDALQSFFAHGTVPMNAGWRAVASVVARKLDYLHAAETLGDLAAPFGNRLERLRGDLRGRYSIRINDRWRLVFVWDGAGAKDVAVMDYH